MSIYLQPGGQRLDILLYTLRSYKAMEVSWSEAYLFIELAPEHLPRKEELEGVLMELFTPSTKVNLTWSRLLKQEDFREVAEAVSGLRGAGPNKLVWFLQNADHPFVDFAPDVLHEGLHLMAADNAPFTSLYFSHWPEMVRLSGKLHNQERVGASYVRFEASLSDAIQIFNSRFFWFLFQQLDWHGFPLFNGRVDQLLHQIPVMDIAHSEVTALYTSKGIQTIYVPLRELCRHFGGYWHVGMEKQWPPMSLEVAPAAHSTRYTSPAQLLSALLAHQHSYWVENPPNTFQIPQEWLRTVLSLYGFPTNAEEEVKLSPEDWP